MATISPCRGKILSSVYRPAYTSPLSQAAIAQLRTRGVAPGDSQYTRDYSVARSVPVGILASEHPSPPLSALPTRTLLRSLVINGISSRPWLLSPSILFLSMLCQTNRSFLFDVDRNRLLAWVMKATLYKQFCAGETATGVKATMKDLRDLGFRGTILTYAQETTFDHDTKSAHGMGFDTQAEKDSTHCQSIQKWRDGTLKTVEMLGEGDQLAVKTTGAGPLVTDALSRGELLPTQMLDALNDICTRCKELGVRILVDAESQQYQYGILRISLDLMRKYNRDGHALIYNTYQAYLKSTPSTLAKHLAAASEEGFTLGLKLVRGAYMTSDQRSLIHDTKENTDEAYNSIAKGALRQKLGDFGAEGGRPFPSVNLVLASHNKESVLAAHELHQQRLREGLPTIPVGYAQLHGMSDEVSFALLQLRQGGSTGPEVYKCSTWGSLGECLGYLARRATENRDAASRTADGYNALKAEAKRRLLSTFSLRR